MTLKNLENNAMGGGRQASASDLFSSKSKQPTTSTQSTSSSPKSLQQLPIIPKSPSLSPTMSSTPSTSSTSARSPNTLSTPPSIASHSSAKLMQSIIFDTRTTTVTNCNQLNDFDDDDDDDDEDDIDYNIDLVDGESAIIKSPTTISMPPMSVNANGEPIYAVVDLKNKYAHRAKMKQMEEKYHRERPNSFHVVSGDYEEVNTGGN